MSEIHPGDVVVNSDPSVVGEVLQTSVTCNGLHGVAELDLWDAGRGPSFANSGLVPVRWDADTGSYEWWEDPEFLTVVHPAVPDCAVDVVRQTGSALVAAGRIDHRAQQP